MTNPLRFATNIILILTLVYLLGREIGIGEWVWHQSRCLFTHDQDCVDEHFGRAPEQPEWMNKYPTEPKLDPDHASVVITAASTGTTSSVIYVCKYNPKDGLETFYSAIPCTENNALPSVRRHWP